MATIKEELAKLFERLGDFTRLGEDYRLGDLAREAKLLLAKQISENFVSKDPQKEALRDDWLILEITEAKVLAEKEANKIKDWDEFVGFKRKYGNLLKSFVRDIGSTANSQKWLDHNQIIDSLNKINLEETWGRGKVVSASLSYGKNKMNHILIAALRSVVGSRFPRYLQMFQKYIDDDPKPPSRETRIKTAIKHAMKVLKREDRVMWYLRKYRDVYLGKDKEYGPATLTKLMQKLEHYMSNAEENNFRGVLDYRFPSDASLEDILRDLKTLEKADEAKVPDEGRALIHLDDYGDTEVTDFMTFDDGWVWHHIDAMSCSLEADSMTHCGNQYGSEGDKILSLRETVNIGANNEDYEEGTYYRPHATFILNDGMLGEMKGVKNNKPGQRLHRYIVPLLEDDRIDGFGAGGYEPRNNFAVSDLPDPTAKGLLTKKPMLGGVGYYIKNVGIDDKIKKSLTVHYDWQFDDEGNVIIDEFKDIAGYASSFSTKSTYDSLDKEIESLEGDDEKIFIDQADEDWVLETFIKRHPDKYEEVVSGPDFVGGEGDEESIFKDIFSSEIYSAYWDASENDYASKAWKNIEEYVEEFTSEEAGGVYLEQTGSLWEPLILKLDLKKADMDDIEEGYNFDLGDMARDLKPTFQTIRWAGMDYSIENEDIAMERLLDELHGHMTELKKNKPAEEEQPSA